MATSAEELRQDIEEQRRAMSGTLDALGDKVSPGRVVERRKAAVRDKATAVKERVMGVPEAAGDVAGQVQDRISETGEAVAHKASELGDKVSDAPQAITNRTQGNPLAAGLIAFGTGLLVASLFPETEPERRAARQVEPKLADAAQGLRQAGQDAAEQLREPLEEAVEDVKSTAREATSHVADDAKGAVDETTSQVTGSGEPSNGGQPSATPAAVPPPPPPGPPSSPSF